MQIQRNICYQTAPRLLLNVIKTCLLGVCRTLQPVENIGYRFSKTEPNRTDLKIQKPKTQFPQFGFQKNDFGSLGTVFHVVSFTIHHPTWQDQQSKHFPSCRVSTLLVLSHFGWQLVGSIQHGSTSFLASYHRGIKYTAYTLNNTQCKNPNWKTETTVNFVKLKLNQKQQFFCKTEPKTKPKSFSANRTPLQFALLQSLTAASRLLHTADAVIQRWKPMNLNKAV